jgi:hypothetical protein
MRWAFRGEPIHGRFPLNQIGANLRLVRHVLREVPMRRIGKLFAIGAGVLAGFILPPAASYAQQPPGAFSGGIHYPIAGRPPLTLDMVQRATNFFQWLLGAPLTPEQQQQFRNAVAQSWLYGRQDEIQSTLQVIQFNDQIMLSKSVTEREIVRQTVQPKYTAQLRAQPNNNLSRWALGIYDAAHKPIAPGNPPLRPQVVDAYVAFLSFMMHQALGNNWSFTGGGSFRDVVAQSMIAGYPTLKADQQAAMAQIPLEWAQLNDAWPKAPLAQQQQLRAQWKPALQQLLDNLNKTAAAKPATAGDSNDQLMKKMVNEQTARTFMNNSMNTINNMVINRIMMR